ncbi:MAG: beta-ketoacyl synthase N-terminal-like domain-containing protein, partial [bacterium]|nr:beta-ketoacyl synthase N-terminal-like domain-containing protein [bacterium]
MFSPLRVAGAHLVTAAGEGVGPAWEALLAGRTLLSPDPELSGFAPIATARCRPIDPAALGVDVRAARLMDHHTHMMLLSVAGALRAAGLGPEEISEGALAFYVGMDSVDPRDGDIMPAVAGSVGAGGRLDLGRFFSGGLNRIPPLWALSMVNAIAFCQIAIQYQIHGDNAVFTPGADAA